MRVRSLGVLLLILIAVHAANGPLTAQEPAGAAPEAEVATAPVEMDGTVLMRVRGVSSFPAAERARLVRERLVAVAADPAISPDALRVVDSGGVTRIMAGEQLIIGLVDADASLEQVQRDELAVAHLARLRQAIVGYRELRSVGALRRDFVNAVVATVVLAAAVVLIWWFWRWLDGVLTRRLQARIHAVEIQSFELMRADRIWVAFRGALFVFRTVAFLLVALVYVHTLLAQFPWTRGLSQNMLAFALGPLEVIGTSAVGNIPSLVFLTILFFVFRLILRLIRLFFHGVERSTIVLSGFEPDWAQPTYNIVRIAVVAFGVIVAYPYIPGRTPPRSGGSRCSLASCSPSGPLRQISNIIAGYMLIYRRAFKVGDRIRVGNAFGEVIETRLQVTHLRSIKNEELIVPNSQILASEVLNYSSLARTRGLILHTEVGIGYETPWRQVEAMLLLAAKRTQGLASDPPPFVLHKKLGDFAVTYELNVFCNDVPRMQRLYTELHRNILDVFNEYNVQIMTPAYEGDPAALKVVPRQDWYAAPAERQQASAGRPDAKGSLSTTAAAGQGTVP